MLWEQKLKHQWRNYRPISIATCGKKAKGRCSNSRWWCLDEKYTNKVLIGNNNNNTNKS